MRRWPGPERHPQSVPEADIDLLDRGIGLFIDYIVVFYLPSVAISVFDPSPNGVDYGAVPDLPWIWVLSLIIPGLFMFPYFAIAEAIFGFTIGKWAVGAVVVMDDGSKLTPKAAIIRNLVRVIDRLPIWHLLGAVIVGLTDSNQRIGDMVAKTRVAPSSKRTSEQPETETSVSPVIVALAMALILGYAFFRGSILLGVVASTLLYIVYRVFLK
jgi:uncharacterized RDD family membrane protein YckC